MNSTQPTKLLFICSKNRRRSYTAEKMFDKSTHYHVRSRGTEKGSRIKLTSADINWADMIFTMEKRHTYFVLIHSGSRRLGQTIKRAYTGEHRAAGLQSASPEAADYLKQHNYAVKWAKASRKLIAKRLAIQIHANLEPVLNLPHNCLEVLPDQKNIENNACNKFLSRFLRLIHYESNY